MGRVVIPKKMVDGMNTLTHEAFEDGEGNDRENTIYVIQYDFTLGEDITVPANCVLEFDGGSISGEHTITGQNTAINAGLVKIFNTDVTLAGTWNVTEAYPEWFGAKGDGVSDDTMSIQKCIDAFKTTHLLYKTYILGSKTNDICITLPEGREIIGENNFTNVSKPTLKATCSPLWVVVVSNRCKVESVSIDGGLDAQGGSYKDLTKTCGIGSNEDWAAGLIIRNNFVFKCYYALNLVTYLSEITHNSCLACYHGFFIHGYGMSTPESIPTAYGTSTLIEGNYANRCQGTGYAIIGLSYSTIQANAADNCGYDGTEFNYVYRLAYLKNVSILSNGAEQCIMVYYIAACSNISIQNCSVWLKKINGYTDSTLHPIDIGVLTSSVINGFSFNTAGSGFDEGELDNYIMLYKSGYGGSMELNEIRLDGKILTYNQVRIFDNNDNSQIKYITPSIGDTSHRPSGFDYKIGMGTTYFDTEIRQLIVWENGWKTVDGFRALKRIGDITDRPSSAFIGVGFSYYDTTLGKPIWWNGTKWIKADGTDAEV
jgi:hypothetical protein